MKNYLAMLIVFVFSFAPHSHAAMVEISYMDVASAHVNAEFLPLAGFALTAVASSENLVGDYIGAITATLIGPGIQTLYTAAFNLDPNGIGPAAGSVLGGSVPFGFADTSAGTIQVNMSGIFADHGPMDQNLGAIAHGSFDSLTGLYTMNWYSVMSQGSNFGQVVAFTFSGNIQVVPIPAAAWLFVCGLVGLIAVARRKSVQV